MSKFPQLKGGKKFVKLIFVSIFKGEIKFTVSKITINRRLIEIKEQFNLKRKHNFFNVGTYTFF